MPDDRATGRSRRAYGSKGHARMYVNTLASHRHGRFLRTSAEGGGGGTGPEGGTGKEGAGKDGGKNEWTPPKDQAEFDRIIQDRLTREQRKFADYDALKAKAGQWDALSAESQSEHEKALAAARAEGMNEAMSKQVPRAVRAEFKAAAKEVGLSKTQLDSLLEDLDLVKYATDDGDPDEEKISKKVSAFAPAKGSGGNGRSPNFGQGSGHNPSTAKKGEAGLAEAQRRYGKSATS